MSQTNGQNTPRRRGFRHEREATDFDCPQGCSETDPLGRGIRRVTHRTGEFRTIEVYGEYVVNEIVERYLECPVCGWVTDL